MFICGACVSIKMWQWVLYLGIGGIDITCTEETLQIMRNCTSAGMYRYKDANGDRYPWCDYQRCVCAFGNEFVVDGGNNTVGCRVRRKGTSTWRNVDGRPSLKLKVDERVTVVEHSTWHTKKFTLNNFVFGKGEMDAYDVFRRKGVPTPRTKLVEVCFSRPCKRQRYVLLESHGDDFAEVHFGEEVPIFEVDLGQIEVKEGNEELTFEQIIDPEAWNQDMLKRYVEGEIEANHRDSFCGHIHRKVERNGKHRLGNNIYIYRVNGLLVPSPHGVDRTMSCDDRNHDWLKDSICPVLGTVAVNRRRNCHPVRAREPMGVFGVAAPLLTLFTL